MSEVLHVSIGYLKSCVVFECLVVTAAITGTYLKDFECRFNHELSCYNMYVLLLCETAVLDQLTEKKFSSR